MKIAILCRVSTDNQSNESTKNELSRIVLEKGYSIYDTYEEVVSGAKGVEERRQLQRLLTDAKRNKFQGVYVWELSRLSRNLRNLINIIEELESLGVTLFSYREGVSTDTPSGKMFVHMLGIMSQWELSVRADRVQRGIKHYRKTHKHWGRRKEIDSGTESRIKELSAKGLSLRKISAEVGVSKTSVHRILS